MSVNVALIPGHPPERDPLLFCPEHWERINWHRRAWAMVWTSLAIQDDRRFKAAMGVADDAKVSKRVLLNALSSQPACCRLGSRVEYLFRA